jgi:hypothetical protein
VPLLPIGHCLCRVDKNKLRLAADPRTESLIIPSATNGDRNLTSKLREVRGGILTPTQLMLHRALKGGLGKTKGATRGDKARGQSEGEQEGDEMIWCGLQKTSDGSSETTHAGGADLITICHFFT